MWYGIANGAMWSGIASQVHHKARSRIWTWLFHFQGAICKNIDMVSIRWRDEIHRARGPPRFRGVSHAQPAYEKFVPSRSTAGHKVSSVTHVSLSLRSKDLLGPVTRVKKKKKHRNSLPPRVSGAWALGFGFRIQGFGFRVSGSWVSGSGFRVYEVLEKCCCAGRVRTRTRPGPLFPERREVCWIHVKVTNC